MLFKGSLFVLSAALSTAAMAESHGHAAPAAHAKPATKPHGTAAAHGAHAAVAGVPAETALGWLKNGNNRFLKGQKGLRKDGLAAKDRSRLAPSQHPHTIVLSCSDSRVPPELVFDQKLGELFVIRVAGEALDSSVVASIEYAVAHLGPQLIMVMGHESCGAVKAALTTPKGETAGSEDLDKLVADIRPRLPSRSVASPSHNFIDESSANARGVAKDLLARSEIIRKQVEAGKVKIVSGLYGLGTGRVEFFE